MLEILQFIFSSFWVWLGIVILLFITGEVTIQFVNGIILTVRALKKNKETNQ
jgi:hypothetical protein